MVPGACATGHDMIGFYGPDLIEEKIDGGQVTYRKPSWPTNTYLSVERLQAAKSSMKGTMQMKFDNNDIPVKIDLQNNMVQDIVFSFANSGFETSVNFINEPTCQELNFDVTFALPGGSISLPKVTGINSALNFTSTMVVEGYEEFKIDMGWFLTAHQKPQVQVIINDMDSVCSGNGQCDFEYFNDLTPKIHDITSSGNEAGTSQLTITGQNIKNLVITSPKCNVISSTNEQVVCTLNEKLSRGVHDFEAFDLENGIPDLMVSDSDQLKIEIVYTVSSISPEFIGQGKSALVSGGIGGTNVFQAQ